MTAYEALGVSPTASQGEIAAAYRRIAKLVHPDVNGDEFLYRELDAAYRCIADPAQRRSYDQQIGLHESRDRTGPQLQAPLSSRARPARSLGYSFASLLFPLGALKVVAVPFVAVWSVTGSVPIAILLSIATIAATRSIVRALRRRSE